MSAPSLPPLRQPKSFSIPVFPVLRQPKSVEILLPSSQQSEENKATLNNASLTVMRRPKSIEETLPSIQKYDETLKNKSLISPSIQKSDEMMVTLKNGSKLIVSSDAYHGILTAGGRYQCAFCEVDIKSDGNWKEVHKFSHYHKKMLENSPCVELHTNYFVRPINPECFYCTTCNAIVRRHVIIRHLASVAHCQEHNKAKKLAG